MYHIDIKENLIRVEFYKLSSIMQIAKVFDYYKNDCDCIITKILLIRYVHGIAWYHDITSYKNSPTLLLLLNLKSDNVKNGAESTHISDSSFTNYNIALEIHTLNKENKLPALLSDDAFKRRLWLELKGLF